ncbi:MAG: adenylosuccinate synthetase [Deltaproteobacteria bacterium]|nr:adenylosuccinate synthetase [Deltaproteobacteria bacterium]
MLPTRRRAVIVVDLGFGDAGKGLVTDALVRSLGARAVVRFNGGAQAGHNVVTPDGRHHTFAQLGSGSLVPGVRTFLSRHVVVHPTALACEADHLERLGVREPLARVTVSAEALLLTPFHQAVCRLREIARGDGRHGSCGVGVGETMRDALSAPEDALRMGDLRDRPRLRRLLERARERLREEASPLRVSGAEAATERSLLDDLSVTDAWIDALPALEILDEEAWARRLAAEPTVIFEGAQGVLLDEWRGFHPFTTWSTCTFDNALELIGDRPAIRLGVLRTYATRHGPGPFPTERPLRLPEPHNAHGPWQGAFRWGDLDLALLRYAIAACGGVDALAVTHLDALAAMSEWRVCRAHLPAPGDAHLFDEHGTPRLGRFTDLDHQSALTEALFRTRPVIDVPLAAPTPARVVRWLGDQLGAPVVLGAHGPTHLDVRPLLPRRSRVQGLESRV